jgi:hypothetical protein
MSGEVAEIPANFAVGGKSDMLFVLSPYDGC